MKTILLNGVVALLSAFVTVAATQPHPPHDTATTNLAPMPTMACGMMVSALPKELDK